MFQFAASNKFGVGVNSCQTNLIMDCLYPIEIINPTKYISLDFSDRYIQKVRCGKCCNCQKTLQREWYYRAFYECKSVCESGGYMLMDCLTYAPKYVPRLSNYFDIPKSLDWMCFDYSHLRLFLVRLRRYLKYRGYDVDKSLRYFASTEYGTDDTKTHRPHIHILFYVYTPDLDNINLSRAISDCWQYGRTDGVRYKGARYVEEYTIRGGLMSSIRSCKYVSKYVVKDSSFQNVLDKRIRAIMEYIYMDNNNFPSYDDFVHSEFGKKIFRDLVRHVNQFHRQSLGFGLSAIRDMDLNEIMKYNLLTIPDIQDLIC